MAGRLFYAVIFLAILVVEPAADKLWPVMVPTRAWGSSCGSQAGVWRELTKCGLNSLAVVGTISDRTQVGTVVSSCELAIEWPEVVGCTRAAESSYLHPVVRAEARNGIAEMIVSSPDAEVKVSSPNRVEMPLPVPKRESTERSGYATFVHWSLQGDVMANGNRYNRWDAGISASNDFPLGKTLLVTYTRTIRVVVSDRGLLGLGQVDLSEAGFKALVGSLEPGRIEISVQEEP